MRRATPPPSVAWLGHSTVLIDLDGARFLTDPLLRRRVAHLRRLAPLPAAPAVDAVLLSHAHRDHLDLPSLRLLPGRPQIVRPSGLRSPAGTEMLAGERIEVAGVNVMATYAEHDGRRSLLPARAPALGYVLEGSRRIYFAGDTDLFAGMATLAPLDLALLPVSGWGNRLPPGHLDPARAAEALRLLRPRVAVPIHWGTYAPPWLRQTAAPAEEFRRRAAGTAPDVEVRVLAVGEAIEL